MAIMSKAADRLKAKAVGVDPALAAGAAKKGQPQPVVGAGVDPTASIAPADDSPVERGPVAEPRMPRIVDDAEFERQRTQPGTTQPAAAAQMTTDPRTGRQVDLSDGALDPYIRSEFQKWGYTPSDAEMDQWRGYLRRPDQTGSGEYLLGPNPYWAMRIGYHARGEDYGTPDNKPYAGMNFGPLASGGAASAPAAGPAAAGGGGSFQLSQSASGPAPSPMDAQVNDAILKLLETPRDRSPEWLKNTPEGQAANASLQRSEERQRADTAQKASVEGWSNSGAFDTEVSGIKQARGEAGAQLMSQIASQYVDRDREDLMQGIQFALSSGQFDKAQALQRELAALEASVQREGMQLDNRYRYDALGENRRQYDMGYGLDIAGMQLNANRDAFLAAYGG